VLTKRGFARSHCPQELCAGGSVIDVLKQALANRVTISEERAALLFRGIIKSVLHCHQVGVLHMPLCACA